MIILDVKSDKKYFGSLSGLTNAAGTTELLVVPWATGDVALGAGRGAVVTLKFRAVQNGLTFTCVRSCKVDGTELDPNGGDPEAPNGWSDNGQDSPDCNVIISLNGSNDLRIRVTNSSTSHTLDITCLAYDLEWFGDN